MSEFREKLGQDGVRRREELLQQLRPIVRGRGRRRWLVRAGVAAVLIGGVVLGAVQWAAGVERTTEPKAIVAGRKAAGQSVVAPPAQDPRPSMALNDKNRGPEPAPRVQLVATVNGLAERVGTPTTGASTATDDDLISALRATGQDPGIVRVDGRLIIAGDFGR